MKSWLREPLAWLIPSSLLKLCPRLEQTCHLLPHLMLPTISVLALPASQSWGALYLCCFNCTPTPLSLVHFLSAFLTLQKRPPGDPRLISNFLPSLRHI